MLTYLLRPSPDRCTYVNICDGDSHTTIDVRHFRDLPGAALRLRHLDCTAAEALATCAVVSDELKERGYLPH